MKRICIKLACLFTVLLMCGCLNKKKTDWRVTLDRDDKKPYGSYLAYNSLKHYFPGTTIKTVSKGFRYTSIESEMKQAGNYKTLLILLGLELYLSEGEVESILKFAREGNEVMIFCSHLDTKLEKELRCYKEITGTEEQKLSEHNTGKQNINALTLSAVSKNTYGYEGRSLQGYFQLKNLKIDDGDTFNTFSVNKPDILGFVHAKPNFIRYATGSGHIILHAAPLVMSNYFLLQKNNCRYLDGMWQATHPDVKQVYWNEYYKHSAQSASLGILWNYPATKWALLIALATLLLYVLFESKRRQRLIPIIEQPENASVSFVETVGRLYYNKGDHNNIAEKIVQHFLEWVRLHYYLNTNELNEQFIHQLTQKSSLPKAQIRELMTIIHNIRLRNVAVDETLLAELQSQLQHLYKNHNDKDGNTRHKPTTAY